MGRLSVPRRSLAGSAFLLAFAILLVVAVPALADYLGPDRHVVDMVEVREPANDYWTCGNSNPPPGILGTCILQNPSNPCPDAGGYHPSKEQQRAWCQWGSNWSDYTGCGCTRAYAYETIEYDLPPATISGALAGCMLQNGWCVTSPSLNLQGGEPLAEYEIRALEGSRNNNTFACPGALCAVPLLEGANAFTFWALSSYGDSSFMGSLSAQVDTVAPATAFTIPPEGSAVWAAGVVSFSGLSGDATSGLASAQISLDGGAAWSPLPLSPDGGWSYTWDTRPGGDAAHAIRARAWDLAGNLGNEAQVIVSLDNTSPSVDLPDRWMIWDPISLPATDGGSGIERLELTIQGGELGVRKYIFASGQGSWAWDRRIEGVLAPVGEYGVTLEAWDALGNQGSDHGILVIPDPGASAPALPEPEAADEAGPASGAPIATEPPSPVTFPPFVGPTPTASGVEASAGLGPEGPQPSTDEAASKGGGSGVLWGAAALAAIGAATAYVLTKKREREEEHEAELAKKKAQAAEWAAQAASLHKQVDANRNAPVAAVAAAAAAAVEAARRRRDQFSEWQQQRREAREVAAQERELEARRRREQAEEAARRAEAARLAAAAAAAERLRAIAERRDEPAPAVEVPWWQRAWDGVREAVDTAVTWVDQHQAAIAVGIGVVAGVAAVLVTGGIAAPLVVAALAAGGVSALGTVGLNAYFDRPLGTNVLRNVGLSSVAAVLTTGVGLAARAGLVGRAALAAGNTVAALCGRNPAACARAEGILQAMDTAEQVVLQAQLAFQIAVGDPRAGETALELQLEYMDGGLPGNSLARELNEQVSEEVAQHGDEAAELVVQYNPLSYWDHGNLARFGDELADRVVPDARALDAGSRLVTLFDEGPLDLDSPQVRELVDTIAENSIQGSGDLMVLGRWTQSRQTGYVGDAHLGDATYFETNPGLWSTLEPLPNDARREVFWAINERVLEMQEATGVTFAHTLSGASPAQTAVEIEAIRLIAGGDTPGALDLLQELNPETDALPFRMLEAQWLLARGYTFEVDLEEQVIRWFNR